MHNFLNNEIHDVCRLRIKLLAIQTEKTLTNSIVCKFKYVFNLYFKRMQIIPMEWQQFRQSWLKKNSRQIGTGATADELFITIPRIICESSKTGQSFAKLNKSIN